MHMLVQACIYIHPAHRFFRKNEIHWGAYSRAEEACTRHAGIYEDMGRASTLFWVCFGCFRVIFRELTLWIKSAFRSLQCIKRFNK
jgi:hypothetical protein